MKKNVRGVLLLSLLTICLFFGSCIEEDDAVTTELLHVWMLQSFGMSGKEQPIIAQSEITLEFDDEYNIRGTACNYYFGAYETKSGGILAIKHLAMTEMACLTPKGIMTQERRYLQSLLSVSAYEVEQDRLRLFYDDGQRVLIYQFKQAEGVEN